MSIRLLHNIPSLLLAALLGLAMATACQDDPLPRPGVPDDGFRMLDFELSFQPLASQSVASRSSGTAIQDIKSLWILVYEPGAGSGDSEYYLRPDLSFKPDAATDGLTITTTTDKSYDGHDKDAISTATFRHVFPYGTYKVIAIANHDLALNAAAATLDDVPDSLRTITKLGSCRFPAWQRPDADNLDEVGTGSSATGFQNVYMSGYFTEVADNQPTDWPVRTPQDVNISGVTKSLHCWLRRAAAKITVEYDASDLNDDIYIYLRSVTVRDVPDACAFFDNNVPTEDRLFQSASTDTDPGDNVGDRIVYYFEGSQAQALTKGDEYKTGWPWISAGRAHYPYRESLEGETIAGSDPHDPTAAALYTYENMQGTGIDKTKLQDADYDGVIDHPSQSHTETDAEGNTVTVFDSYGATDADNPKGVDFKDGVKGCTYIEVEAYYVSAAKGNEGQGPITYRFALGKDAVSDFNVERNTHYRITLKFNGYANDIDWHVEYIEQDNPGIFVPENFLVSYLANTPSKALAEQNPPSDAYWEFCYPIRLAGNTIGDEVTVAIYENNWGPCGENGEVISTSEFDYFQGDVLTAQSGTTITPHINKGAAIAYSGPWHGFLSLYKQPSEQKILDEAAAKSAAEYIWWFSRGDKEYRYYNKNNDSYTNCTTVNVGNVTKGAVTYTKNKKVLWTENGIQREETIDKFYEYGEGYRVYKTTLDGASDPDNGECVYDVGGSPYKVVRRMENGERRVTIYVPLFTRPLQIIGAESWSGNNPYVPYRRMAKLYIAAEVNGSTKYKADCRIYQVRRIVNPKAILRRGDNQSPFTVTLCHTNTSDIDATMIPVQSQGGWRATIYGSGWKFVGANEGLTGSTIRFTVQPTGTAASGAANCAVVLVEYHNYRCTHKIALRQGYDPVEIGGKKWLLNNLEYVSDDGAAHVSACPLNEGSMFRYGNLTQPIDAINNTFHPDLFSRDETPNKTYAFSNGKYLLAPVNPESVAETANGNVYKTWSEIIPTTNGFYNTFTKAYSGSAELAGSSYRVARKDDFQTFLNGNYEFGFGMVYGDGATANARSQTRATHHSWFAKKESIGGFSTSDQYFYGLNIGGDGFAYGLDYNSGTGEGAYGMRCCVAFDGSGNDAYKSIVLPIGMAGHGRRKGKTNAGTVVNGTLHYAVREKANVGDVQYRPLLYRLYGNFGAIYWLGNDKAYVWDLNYSTFDFGAIDISNAGIDGNVTSAVNSSACFIRLIQD